MAKKFLMYGTLMAHEAMQKVCGDAEYLGNCSIKARLGFNERGLPTCVPCDSLELWGTLWNISDANEKNLDRHETSSYRKQTVKKGAEQIFFYVSNDQIEGDPQRAVLDNIIKTSERLQFPSAYVDRLKRLRSPRTRFIESWYGRGLSAKNPFDRFVFLYIALTVLAKADTGGSSDEDGEGKLVVEMLTSDPFKARIKEAIKEEPIASAINKLLQRQRKRGGDGVLVNQRTQKPFKLEPVPKVESLGWLLVATRNNLFHGAKCYTEADDIDLMASVTPILATVLRIAIDSIEPEILQ